MDTLNDHTDKTQAPDPRKIFEDSIHTVVSRGRDPLRRKNNMDVLLSMGVDCYDKLQAEVLQIQAKVSDRSSQERAILSGVYFLVNRKTIQPNEHL